MAKELLQKEYAGPNGWTIWAVEGRIDTLTAETAYAFGEELVQKNAKTVLDMQEMDYLSSAGLRCAPPLQTGEKGREGCCPYGPKCGAWTNTPIPPTTTLK